MAQSILSWKKYQGAKGWHAQHPGSLHAEPPGWQAPFLGKVVTQMAWSFVEHPVLNLIGSSTTLKESEKFVQVFASQPCFVELQDGCLCSLSRLLALASSTRDGGGTAVCGIRGWSRITLLLAYGFLSLLLTKTSKRGHTHPRTCIRINLSRSFTVYFFSG